MEITAYGSKQGIKLIVCGLALEELDHLSYIFLFSETGFKIRSYTVYLVDAGKKCNPVRFNYFHHHVILKILHTVEHTLSESKC
jgi:hypothetical protein